MEKVSSGNDDSRGELGGELDNFCKFYEEQEAIQGSSNPANRTRISAVKGNIKQIKK